MRGEVATGESNRRRWFGTPLVRTRLLGALDDAGPVVVLAAPRGFGKRTLARQWLRAGADAGAEVHEATARAVSDSGRCLGIVEEVIAAAAPARPCRVVIVLEDGADGTAGALGPGALEDIAVFSSCHPGIRVLIIARTRSAALAAATAGMEVGLLGAAELAFTDAEFADLLRVAGIEFPPASSSAVNGFLGGVPALADAAEPALRHLAASGWADDVGYIDPYDDVWAPLRASVAGRVEDSLAGLPRATRNSDMFTALAVLGSAPVRTLAAIASVEDPAAVTAWADTVGVQWSDPGRDDERWSVAPVARWALVERIADGAPSAGPEVLDALTDRLAASGDQASALRVLMAVGDWPRATEFMRRDFSHLMRQDIQLVRTFLEVLPPECSRHDPMVEMGRSVFAGLDAGTFGVVTRMSRSADGLGNDALGDDAGLPLSDVVSGATASIVLLRLSGAFEDGAALATRIADRVAGVPSGEHELIKGYLPLYRGQWAIAHELAGDLATAEAQFRETFAESKALGVDFMVKNAAGTLAMNDALTGAMDRARRWLAIERQYPDPGGWLATRVRIPGRVADVFLALDAIDVDAAETALDALGTPEDTEEFWAPMIHAHCAVLLNRGSLQEGLDLIDRALRQYSRWAPPRSFAERTLSLMRCDLLTALGRGNEALRAVDGPPRSPGASVRAARIHLLNGDLAAVHEKLGDCSGLAGRPCTFIDGLVICAAAHAARGEDDRARAALGRAAAAAQHSGSVRPLLLVPRMHRQRMLQLLPDADPIRAVWEKHDDVDVFAGRLTMVTLTPRELAVLRLIAEGKSRREIAATLFVSENTVKTQLSSVYRKLTVHNRDQAVEAARRLSLF
ncbi:helix-turn-helix transcriptional regulator [Tomitella gaofuii]|uniref:helix-turn-helix transcriptional regulator n=1 Tax=Tomitella gaofuii TaxID=2760083 RepID=UPI0015F82978|nr:helix-turn-helix transcriptional regulator [Tomitella gaofuii]